MGSCPVIFLFALLLRSIDHQNAQLPSMQLKSHMELIGNNNDDVLLFRRKSGQRFRAFASKQNADITTSKWNRIFNWILTSSWPNRRSKYQLPIGFSDKKMKRNFVTLAPSCSRLQHWTSLVIYDGLCVNPPWSVHRAKSCATKVHAKQSNRCEWIRMWPSQCGAVR